MASSTVQHRRPRSRPQKTTGVIVRTMHDARGIVEPLERYGELHACQIVGLYNAIHGLPDRSEHCRARLGRLFHEAEGLPRTAQLLTRPAYQWRFGYNHQTAYRRAPGTARFLITSGIYDLEQVGWAERSRIVQGVEELDRAPSDHDAGLSFVMSSIEIGVRRAGLRFISHIDIIKNASPDAQSAASPLSIPIPELSHEFANQSPTILTDVHVRPDAMFGVEYPPRDDPSYRFFALEYDRGTEDIEPAKNLARASWLRKVLSYAAISAGSEPIFETYLKVPSLFVLCVFPDRRRMEHAMKLVDRYAAERQQFLFKVIGTLEPFLCSAPVPGIFIEPWQSLGGTQDIGKPEGRR